MEEEAMYADSGPTAEMKMQALPHEIRKLRACLLCSLIKSEDQFEMDGCDNCDEFLHMRNNIENVHDFTSSSFEGMIALMSPEESWVGKWQRVDKCVQGMYAISVAGHLPRHMVQELKSHGIVYRSRDTSHK
ncbi:transcription elongation factor SPT4-A-like [Convolutriloba macropyga]|uniref:transcription elongation factor SPT4-A-like n=1 Tax=Convolutriloba macropyga TaxID=536237 RepID=UPI003F523513